MTTHRLAHPLAQQLLTQLRDKNTPLQTFRHCTQRLCTLLVLEATQNLPLQEYRIQTPLEETSGYQLQHSLVFVPILRAGLGFVDAAISLYPEAEIGFIGLARDEASVIAERYYTKLPAMTEQTTTIIVDPMLATGGSFKQAIDIVSEQGCNNIIGVSIVAAPEGIAMVEAAYPDIPLYTASIDTCLDENHYIRPGLGDFGDRLCSIGAT